MINMPRIRTFMEVAECLSFTEAANRLYTTQSSISKGIAAMEQGYGFKLFDRSNKKIQLTPEGEFLYEKFSEMVDGIDGAIEKARHLGSTLVRSCKLAFPVAYTNTQEIHGLIQSYLREHPQFNIELDALGYKVLREELISGSVDGIITKTEDVAPIAGCETLCLTNCRPVIVIAKNHPLLKNQDTLTLSDLAGCDFICLAPRASIGSYNLLINSCNAYSFEPKIVMQTQSLPTLFLNIAIKDYVAVLDESSTPGGHDMLKVIPIENIPTVPVSLAWKTSNDNPALRSFIEYAAMHAE